MSVKIIELKLIKSTKGTHVYGDDSDGAIIPTVYIKKAGLPTTPPQNIVVKLEYEV
jgi:hypothetical protein